MEKTKNKQKYFLGIDLGGENKKTTGVCILKEKEEKISLILSKVILGKEILKEIKNYLNDIKVVAIDAPLTKGKGKGKMRLFEKFLSLAIFRKERINPLPPALMLDFCNFARQLVKKLEKKGFLLDLNLIEVFPNFVEKIANEKLFKIIGKKPDFYKIENKRSAFVCAVLAYLHFNFKTRYLGYKDGFLFLPEFSFWKEKWQKTFLKTWLFKPKLKYRHLTTNLFEDYGKGKNFKNFK